MNHHRISLINLLSIVPYFLLVSYCFASTMHYFRWVFDRESHTIELIEVETIEVSCLLCNIVSNDCATFARDGSYAVITAEWEELLQNSDLGLQPWSA